VKSYRVDDFHHLLNAMGCFTRSRLLTHRSPLPLPRMSFCFFFGASQTFAFGLASPSCKSLSVSASILFVTKLVYYMVQVRGPWGFVAPARPPDFAGWQLTGRILARLNDIKSISVEYINMANSRQSVACETAPSFRD